MVICPNCRQPVADGDAFCAMCGVAVPSGAAPFVPAASPTPVRKVCANGHSWNDPDLLYCPDCGLELTAAYTSATWKCSHCGVENEGEGPICMFCGKNRYTPVITTPKERPKAEETYPAGLRSATQADLARK